MGAPESRASEPSAGGSGCASYVTGAAAAETGPPVKRRQFLTRLGGAAGATFVVGATSVLGATKAEAADAFVPLLTTGANLTNAILSSKIPTDTVPRFALGVDGSLRYGRGNAPTDVIMYPNRDVFGRLKFRIAGNITEFAFDNPAGFGFVWSPGLSSIIGHNNGRDIAIRAINVLRIQSDAGGFEFECGHTADIAFRGYFHSTAIGKTIYFANDGDNVTPLGVRGSPTQIAPLMTLSGLGGQTSQFDKAGNLGVGVAPLAPMHAGRSTPGDGLILSGANGASVLPAIRISRDPALPSPAFLLHFPNNSIARLATGDTVQGIGLDSPSVGFGTDAVIGFGSADGVSAATHRLVHTSAGEPRLSFRVAVGGVYPTQLMLAATGVTAIAPQANAVALAARAAASQSQSLFEVQDAAGTIFSRFDRRGYFMTRRTTAPADADLVPSELALWFDDIASRFMVKAKKSDGTVCVGSVELK
jgi:hypothetical protein